MVAFVLKDSSIVLYFASKSGMFGGIISGLLLLFLISTFFSSSVLFKSKSVKITVLIPSKSNRLINW